MNASDRALQSDGTVTAEQFRQALSCFASGVTVVTTLSEQGDPIGLTVDSFNSVSMDPPLVLWSLGLTAPSLQAFREHSAFVVNVLAHDQLELCRQFGKHGIDKFAGVNWSPGLHGVPVLSGTVATLQCQNYRQYEGGDHEIFLGEVVATRVSNQPSLVYHRGQFSGIKAPTT